MSYLLPLVFKWVLLTLLLGYKNGANNSFNGWFLSNTELIKPCGKIVSKWGLCTVKANASLTNY